MGAISEAGALRNERPLHSPSTATTCHCFLALGLSRRTCTRQLPRSSTKSEDSLTSSGRHNHMCPFFLLSTFLFSSTFPPSNSPFSNLSSSIPLREPSISHEVLFLQIPRRGTCFDRGRCSQHLVWKDSLQQMA